MWFLDIKCIALLVACILNPDPNPRSIQRFYQTKAQCDEAAVQVAREWKPGSAAWSFSCHPTLRR